MCFSVLQHFAVCCSVVHRVAACCIELQCVANDETIRIEAYNATHCHTHEWLYLHDTCVVVTFIIRISFKYYQLSLQHTAIYCNALQHTATHCNTLQHTATHCNTLQLTATHCNTLQHTATRCNTLQHAAPHCNTLQHTATHCKMLQHIATRYQLYHLNTTNSIISLSRTPGQRERGRFGGGFVSAFVCVTAGVVSRGF